MKKIYVILFSLSFIFVSNINAQSFEQGLLSVSPGINLGGFGLYGSGSGLPLVASAEYGIHEYIGVGPYVGFVNYNYGSGSFKYNYKFITVGVRGDFHYTTLLEELLEGDLSSDKLDLYVALLLGYRTVAYSGPDGTTFRGLYNNNVSSGITLGGRYYVNEKFAIFAEVGRSLYGALNLGVTIRLK